MSQHPWLQSLELGSWSVALQGNFSGGGGGWQSHFSRFFPLRDFSFFPVEISILVDPEIFQWFTESEKQKRKKKSSAPQLYFVLFPLYSALPFSPLFCSFSPYIIPPSLSIFLKIFPHFPPPLFHFSSFSSTFPSFLPFSLPHFSRLFSKNFPVESLWGALCPLPPACYAT